MAVVLEFLDDPGTFVDAAHDLLAARPVEATVVATVTERLCRDAAQGMSRPHDCPLWWLVVRDDDPRSVGAGMRTATRRTW